jgi:hypothetical protein
MAAYQQALAAAGGLSSVAAQHADGGYGAPPPALYSFADAARGARQAYSAHGGYGYAGGQAAGPAPFTPAPAPPASAPSGPYAGYVTYQRTVMRDRVSSDGGGGGSSADGGGSSRLLPSAARAAMATGAAAAGAMRPNPVVGRPDVFRNDGRNADRTDASEQPGGGVIRAASKALGVLFS